MSFSTTLTVATPSDLEVTIERMFDAPADLVFDCYTKPDLVRRWMTGMDGWWVSTCDIDPRPGGTYRYVWSGPDGESMGLNGVFHEVERPARLVTTESFDDDFGMGKMLIESEFHAEGDRTRLKQTITYESKGQRDASLATGMTDGMGISFASLDAVLAELTGK
ncbi:MAG: SRPBCC family protein [Pelagibacterium sp.]|uniref:SRPBCC family protein n=1 Tax=Pelagibacterium sp. TaxID=1967288 RepID=UPI0032EEBD12